MKQVNPTLLMLTLMALFVPLLASCDSTAASPTVAPFASGGLGLSRAQWEQKHTFILAIPGSDYIYDGYNAPLFGYRVNFWQTGANDPTARIYAIAVDSRLVLSDTGTLSPSSAGTATVSKDQMRQAVQTLLPVDAQLKDTESPSPKGTFTETYTSNLLKTVYPPLNTLKDPWGGQPPGTIKVAYEGGGPSVLITAGEGVKNTGSPLEILPTNTPGH